MNISVFYTSDRKRALKVELAQHVTLRFNWSRGQIDVLHMPQGWSVPTGHICDVRIYVGPCYCTGGYHWMPPDRSWLQNATCDFAHPGPIADLLQIARFVAAGKAESLMLLGWIEDNWEHPWSLLASPKPVEAIRALCPKPLAVSEYL